MRHKTLIQVVAFMLAGVICFANVMPVAAMEETRDDATSEKVSEIPEEEETPEEETPEEEPLGIEELPEVEEPSEAEGIGEEVIFSETLEAESDSLADFAFTDTKDGRGYSITSYTGSATELVMPSEYNGKPVLELGASVFRNKGLTSVKLPEMLEKIGMGAFYYCKLSVIDFPDSVVSIGSNAFGANELSTVKIPVGLTELEDNVFSGNRIETIEFNEVIKEIGYQAFGKNSLKELNLPASVENIEDWAFSSNQLKAVVIPDAVTHIGYSAFGNNDISGEIVIPEKVDWIEGSAFVNNSIHHVTFLGDPAKIESGAFNSNRIMAITVPESVTFVLSSAFENQNCTVTAVKTGNNQWEIDLVAADEKLIPERVRFTKPSTGITYDNTTGILYANDYAMTRQVAYSYRIAEDGYYAVPEVKMYKEKRYTVVFKDIDGNELGRDVVGEGEAATAPGEPTRQGYTFEGWDKTFDNISDYTEVTAQYSTREYTVRYDTQGGAPIEDKAGVLFTDDHLLPGDPVKEGAVFAGWKLGDREVTNAESYENLVTDDTVMEITLTAQWNPYSYEVIFDKNTKKANGVMENQAFLYGEKKSLSDNQFSNDGYDFAGWSKTSDGILEYADGQSVINLTFEKNGKVILYAVWNEKREFPYAIEHYKQKKDGTWPKKASETEQKNAKYHTEVKGEPKAYQGYLFDNAVKGSVLSGIVDEDGKLILKLYYRILRTVEFDSDGGNYTPDNQQMVYGDKVKEPDNPEKKNHKFLGWYYKDADDKEVKWNFDSEVTADVKLTARWEKAGEAIGDNPKPSGGSEGSSPGGTTEPPENTVNGENTVNQPIMEKAPATAAPTTKEPITKAPATKEPTVKTPNIIKSVKTGDKAAVGLLIAVGTIALAVSVFILARKRKDC